MSEIELTACEWFQEASYCYVEKHQGCPWCKGANRVYKSVRGQSTEYLCGGCDFFACHDQETGQYFMGPGRKAPAAVTMHANQD
jgi:hypothetical protein